MNLYVKPLQFVMKHVIGIHGLHDYKLGNSTRNAINSVIDYKHTKPYDEDLDISSIEDLKKITDGISLPTQKRKT